MPWALLWTSFPADPNWAQACCIPSCKDSKAAPSGPRGWQREPQRQLLEGWPKQIKTSLRSWSPEGEERWEVAFLWDFSIVPLSVLNPTPRMTAKSITHTCYMEREPYHWVQTPDSFVCFCHWLDFPFLHRGIYHTPQGNPIASERRHHLEIDKM